MIMYRENFIKTNYYHFHITSHFETIMTSNYVCHKFKNSFIQFCIFQKCQSMCVLLGLPVLRLSSETFDAELFT